jgi:2-polyprenyl-6-methoxyphenol hydroxylase-like FAD-dependent oxidoreductase
VTLATRYCVAGGGPAGMMLGFLLARAGHDVIVLEKHADFFRDFRGDTIHPSTFDVIAELGLLDAFLAIKHTEIRALAGQFGDEVVQIADFTHSPTRCKFLGLMPQWDFLNFLAEHARAYPTFRLLMETEVTGLVYDGERVAGVRARTAGGELEIRADLVVGADGRSSVVRAAAGLEVLDIGAPIDVLWFRLSKKPGDPGQTFGRVGARQFLVMLDRGDYWQCAYVIRKGGFDEIRERDVERFRADIVQIAAFLSYRVVEIATWDDVRLLTVKIDRLREWYRDGLLCIGDAAHAMSPIAGVGINLAIQDAVGAANILCTGARDGRPAPALLRAVQQRREMPARVTQAVQVFLQARFIDRVLGSDARVRPPLFVQLLDRWPLLRRLPAYAVGVGVRPEHVRTPAVTASQPG